MAPRLARARWIIAAISLPVVLGTCTEGGTGPAHRVALSVTTTMPSAAELQSFNLVIDNVRLIVVRPPADTLFNAVFSFPADQTELPLQANVDLESDQEDLEVTIQLLSGTQVLFSGTQTVTVGTSPLPPQVTIPVTYSGPGQNVATLTVDPPDSVLSFGAGLTLRATARDSQGVVVPNVYLGWSTSDANLAPIDANGHLVAPLQRTSVTVTAAVPNGVTGSTPLTFVPIATAISIVSGCGQFGSPGTQLLQPIVVQVIAGDGLGVKGITVQFTAPVGGSVATPTAVTDDNGLAQTLATLPQSGSADFSIGATGLSPVTCTQTILGGTATHLVFTVQPSSIIAGNAFLVTVTAADALGATVTSFNGLVTLTLGANPGGISFGTANSTAVAGVATFAGLSITTAASGYTLVASSSGLTSATSAPFNVVPSASSQLAFTVQPGGQTVTVGVPITPAVVVVVQDQFGNIIPTATNTITMAIGNNPGGATLGGTLAQAAVAGAAAFTLTLDQVGTGYTLVASSTGLSSTTSAAFDVVQLTGLHLVFTTQPSNVTAGSVMAPPVVVTVQDAQNNPATSFTGNVTLGLGNCGTATLLGTTTVAAVAGVATFADLRVDRSGGCILVTSSTGLQSVVSANFTVSAGAAAQLAFTVQPSNVLAGAIISPIVRVEIQDTLGNTNLTAIDNVTVAIGNNPGNAILGGITTKAAAAGVALFTNLTLDKAGTGYTLIATSGSLAQATSAAFNVTGGAVTHFAVVAPPSVTAGVPATFTVTAQDASNNTVTGYTGTVGFTSSDQGATLPAPYTFVPGDNGTHTFTGGITLTLVGSQSVTATDQGTPSVTGSATATVSPGVANKLAFVVQPAAANAGSVIAPPVVIAVHDAFDNLVPTATDPVTVAIGAGSPGGATLGGTTTVAAVGGLATFADLSIDIAGSGFRLASVAPGLTGAISAPFNVAALTSGVSWNNPSGGNWSVPGNWSPARVPGKTDTVFITLPGAYTVTLDVNDTVAFLMLGGSGTPILSGANRTLGVDSVATIAPGATLDLVNTALNGGGSLANQGTLRLQNTVVSLAVQNLGLLIARSSTALNGAFTTSLGSTFRVEGDASCCSANVTVATGFTNNGALELTAISGSGTSSQLNVTTGTLTNGVNGTISSLVGNGGARTLAAELANQGTVTIAQPLTLSKASAAHTNSGTLTVGANVSLTQSGTSPSFTTTGTITVALGTTLSVSSGAFNYSGGAIGGLGSIAFSSTTLALGQGITNDTLQLSFTNSTVNGPGTLTNAAGATLVLQNTVVNAPTANAGLLRARSSTALNSTLTNVLGAILRIEGDASCCSANVTVANSFTNNGAIELTAISGAGTSSQLNVTTGTLTNAVGGTISSLVGNGGARTLAAQLANQGTVTVAQPLTLTKASAAHTNSGTLTVAANLSLSQSGTTPSFTNTGTITVAGGVSLAVSSGAFNYTGGAIGGLGTIDFSSATLGLTPGLTNDTLHLSFTNSTVNGPGTLTNAAGATLVVQNTAVNAPMNNLGLVRARSNTTFNSTLTNVLGAILRIEGDASCCSANVTVATGFTNNGAIELTAISGSGTSSQLNVTAGTLTNAVGGTISSLVGNGGSRTLAAQLANLGTVTITQPLTLSKASATHTNSGTLTVGANLSLTQSGATPSFTTTGTITVASGVTLAVSSGAFTYSAGAIGGLGTVDFSSATLGLGLGLTNDTLHLSFINSTVNGPGTLTNAVGATLVVQNTAVNAPMANTGLLRARSNTAFNATLTNVLGAILRIEGDASCCSATVTVANSFTNSGAIELTAISGSGTSSQLNVTNGTLTNAGSGTISALVGNGGSRTLAAQLANQGTVSIAQPLTLSKASAAHTNTGTVTVAANLALTQSGTTPSFTNTGTITIALGTTLSVSSGVFNYTSGAIGGLGSIDFSGATLDMTPNFMNDTLHLSFTNSTVNGSGILGNAAGATLVVQNTAVNTGMGNQGLLRARSSTAFNGAFSNVGGSAILRIEGDASCCSANVTVASGFTNNGSIELTAINGSGTSSLLNVTSGILTNASGASIKSLPGNGGARTLGAQVDNQGTMSISQAMTLTFPAAGQVNSGLIQLTGGDLTVVLSGFRPGFANDPNGVIDVGTNKLVINNQSTGTFLNNAGATLRGAGTIDIGTASFITNGITTVGGAVPGFLNFAGPYMQGPSPSALNVRIDGDPAKPGVDYDQLRVVDGAALGNSTLQGGFLNIAAGASVQGKTYVIIQLPAGRTFTGSLGQINIVSGFCDVVSPTGPFGNQYLLTCS